MPKKLEIAPDHYKPSQVRLVLNPQAVTLPTLNPLTIMSDQDRISPYNINTISTR